MPLLVTGVFLPLLLLGELDGVTVTLLLLFVPIPVAGFGRIC